MNIVKTLMKNNFRLAKKFNSTVRYIDDLLTLNNPSFLDEIPNIYPRELVLKKTTESAVEVSYLDVKIGIEEERFVTSVYDKRDSFNFHIVNFPFLNSNIPTAPAYGVYISQLVRVGRISSCYSQFVLRNKSMTSRLIKQGFRYSKLCKTFKKFCRKHVSLVKKFGACVRRHVSDGIELPLCVWLLGRHILQTNKCTCMFLTTLQDYI